jgi:tetratricopeptide (TPR) repeat protein
LITSAQKAAVDGRHAVAVQAYSEALEISPESAYLYRGLASIDREIGNVGSALENITRANFLEPSNPDGFVFQAEILESMGDLEGAEQAYSEANRLNPSNINTTRLAALKARLALSRLPPSYRAISDSSSVTRGELAALVGIRLDSLLSVLPRDETLLITDTRGHWAEPWVRTISQAGVMEVFLNHTFEPNQILQRGELAKTVESLLVIIGNRFPEKVFNWKNHSIDFSDLLPRNIQHKSAAMAVVSGVMSKFQDGTFRLTGRVSGQEAIEAVRRILDIYEEAT